MTMKNNFPSVKLTQQDFVSTFPWGFRGDRVRIWQQEVENELLAAESAAAMAVMLGSESFTERIDAAWKTLLNSQNHDVHVCMQDDAGIAWCKEAMPLAQGIKADASKYIANALGADVEINTLSWNRKDCDGNPIPAFGYAPKACKTAEAELVPWTDWFDAGTFSVKLNDKGIMEIKVGDDTKKAFLGNMTIEVEGVTYNTVDNPPVIKDAVVDAAAKKAYVKLEGKVAMVSYVHTVTVAQGYIDFTTELDYGDGAHFGPAIKDFEEEPRRAHYFMHERKLCMNFALAEEDAEMLYVSPFLTWPVEPEVISVDSLHYVALQGKEYGLAHMNIGQSGYAHDQKASACKHVLSYAPMDYIYARPAQLELKGKHVHNYRFMPYAGDWRQAGVPKSTSEFNVPVFTAEAEGSEKKKLAAASLLKLNAASTYATALFERDGRIYMRIAEWAGQEDTVEIIYGGEDSVYIDCTHALEPIAKLGKTFKMRPWEIKTVLIEGKAASLSVNECCCEKTFAARPSGWEIENQFKSEGYKGPRANGDTLYFCSGYHDGFVRPLEQHTPTMEIEMNRTKQYEGYTQTWEIGGSCWVRMAVNEPEFLEDLKGYLKDGSVEITGGTWCEPFSLIVSGESNIRQMFYGMRAFKETLNYQVGIYNNQEHGTYAQMPQILRSFGLYAVVNRTQWAPFGYESAVDSEVANWIGPDGTGIWLIPRYHYMQYLTCPWDNRNVNRASITGHYRSWRTDAGYQEMFDEAQNHGVAVPLITMLEDIWSPALRVTDEEMEYYSSIPYLKFINFLRYLEMFGITPENN